MADNRQTGVSVWGRIADYIFGRNSLIGIASLMLLVISGYATWSGMADFIIGVSTSPSAAHGREIVGGLSVSNEILVIAVVVALTFLMWLALRETFGYKRLLGERLITFPLYLFLALWSIGFGYGFWWSLIAGEEATRTSLAALQEDARDAGNAVAARLDAVKSQLDNVVAWSDSQMMREESSGGSCGTSSGAGRGPLYNARRSVRDSVASLRDGIQRSWLEPVQADIQLLQQSAASLTGETVEARQREFETRASQVRSRAKNIAARSNELGQSTAAEMRALAGAVDVSPGKAGFSCYDPTLAQRLRQAADQAAAPAELKLRAAVFTEGPAGVANAIKNLWANIGAYAGSLVEYVASGGKVAATRTTGGEPITGRDLIALLATLGIDLGLFALTALNPPATPPARHMPTPALIRQIRQAMSTAIARIPGGDADKNLEWVRRHFIHHNKASYFIIPNLYSCNPDDEDEAARALAMNQLAGVFDDLDLIRWPRRKPWWKPFGRGELDRLKAEEELLSDTDLTDIRKKHIERLEKQGIDVSDPQSKSFKDARPLRNHGLFSKAERALTIAGWSEGARRDIEIFRVVDQEGLTPLLMVLNEPLDDDVAAEHTPPAVT
ncbi:MAG: hypothetical protein KDJ47_17490 [Hyphomicrobiaceae bacterium]|nr:hypothetical protein [Hyphomicrobiaceae bacterium]